VGEEEGEAVTYGAPEEGLKKHEDRSKPVSAIPMICQYHDKFYNRTYNQYITCHKFGDEEKL
jgi:hypothetical protein